MQFKGKVYSRSFKKKGGPPGEAELIDLNPKRRSVILKIMRWDDLFKGTLNLEVNEEVVENLMSKTPIIREPGNEVNYPKQFSHIPKKRIAYLYFKGIITFKNKSEEVLFRTSENPPSKTIIEVFAQNRLRASLNLNDEECVLCKIDF